MEDKKTEQDRTAEAVNLFERLSDEDKLKVLETILELIAKRESNEPETENE